MSKVTVCVRFRPLNSKEKGVHGDSICIQPLDAESFVFKDEKEEDLVFCFDRVFYQDSVQADLYEFLALPIVQDTVDGINGTIITYGQTGAGKTYSMEVKWTITSYHLGLGILECDEHKKGLLPRVVDGLFKCLNSCTEAMYTVKLSMVEIYMEKIRDLFDLSKDNLQIKESKSQGIFLAGTTEISILDYTEALKCLANGIANRAVGETQMNMSSSRSHCVYIFSVQRESAEDGMIKSGKLILVDLAGSEKVEKTGAEGRVLEESKTINKSLSALGNVINALTSGRMNHIPYRDSKLTRILQDALGGNSRTALLCCCSPSSSNSSESLSTLRFGTRTKLIKTPSRPKLSECRGVMQKINIDEIHIVSPDRILDKLRKNLSEDSVNLLEELFILEGIFFDALSIEELESACDDATIKTISALEQATKDLRDEVEELKRENNTLKTELAAVMQLGLECIGAEDNRGYFSKCAGITSFLYSLVQLPSLMRLKWYSSWSTRYKKDDMNMLQ